MSGSAPRQRKKSPGTAGGLFLPFSRIFSPCSSGYLWLFFYSARI
ncbi:hypothetical protein BACCAP_00481 [Pseudoflavonifractor capillosus ATCC 29799]|uniref:Uncharacterized protein n=1 Tax=Pseudoflavonifractor capillosus ATCC 29799 TaxID=411467 RepID=A6NQL0_9FIRM|nr:hypothetical protein BACCAP_00481 [Pseudoflavonifractor capillosus ATCC 29799]